MLCTSCLNKNIILVYEFQLIAASPHSRRVPGSTPWWGLTVWSLHVLPVYAWVLSGYSSFLPLSKNMHVRLTGVSKIVLRSECVCGCLSRLSLCGPVMDWRPVQGVPRLSPNDFWDRLQTPCNPTDRLSECRKWMDEFQLKVIFQCLCWLHSWCLISQNCIKWWNVGKPPAVFKLIWLFRILFLFLTKP